MPLTEINSRLFGHFLIGNGFCVGGGPLFATQTALTSVLEEAATLGRARQVAYVEIRDFESAPAPWQSKSDLYAGFEGPIAANEADNLKQIPRKQRAVVRKALEQGFTISIERSIRPFFDLYARTLRDHGTPILPRRFYESLLTVFGEACEILTVRKDGVPISSVMSFFYRDKVLPYYTGSIPQARRSGANDMMYWALDAPCGGTGRHHLRFRAQQGRHRSLQLQEQLGFRAPSHNPPISSDRARYACPISIPPIRVTPN